MPRSEVEVIDLLEEDEIEEVKSITQDYMPQNLDGDVAYGYHARPSEGEGAIAELEEQISSTREEIANLENDRDMINRQIETKRRFLEKIKRNLRECKRKFSRQPDTPSSALNPTGRFSWDQRVMDTLRGIFKIPSFRPHQKEVINTTLQGIDSFVIMPTGGGKSLLYQLPALLGRGYTVVVSPLLSLIQDQVTQLKQLGIPAEALCSAATKSEKSRIFKLMYEGGGKNLRLVYLTPEMLSKSKKCMATLEAGYSNGRIDRFVIDEAHCCSTWGHDFRPDYKNLRLLRAQMPHVPILALTATATEDVFKDVSRILKMKKPKLYKSEFNRPNLYYSVLQKKSNQNEVHQQILDWIKKKHQNQTGIVYCYSCNDCEKLAQYLDSNQISAQPYHAQLDVRYRESVYKRWSRGIAKVICATIAFGMGINKLDVRFVIHQTISKAMEGYYQESGRAGRDGGRADCVLLYHPKDLTKQSTRVMHLETGLQKLYAMIDYATNFETCRRTLIARYFGEVFPRSQCRAMCDLCAQSPGVTAFHKIDVSRESQGLLRALEKSMGKRKGRGKKKGVTGNQLVDEYWKSTKKGDRMPKLTKDIVFHILVAMLKAGMIKEAFRHTSYACNSYFVQGSFSRRNSLKAYLPLPNPNPDPNPNPATPHSTGCWQRKLGNPRDSRVLSGIPVDSRGFGIQGEGEAVGRLRETRNGYKPVVGVGGSAHETPRGAGGYSMDMMSTSKKKSATAPRGKLARKSRGRSLVKTGQQKVQESVEGERDIEEVASVAESGGSASSEDYMQTTPFRSSKKLSKSYTRPSRPKPHLSESKIQLSEPKPKISLKIRPLDTPKSPKLHVSTPKSCRPPSPEPNSEPKPKAEPTERFGKSREISGPSSLGSGISESKGLISESKNRKELSQGSRDSSTGSRAMSRIRALSSSRKRKQTSPYNQDEPSSSSGDKKEKMRKIENFENFSVGDIDPITGEPIRVAEVQREDDDSDSDEPNFNLDPLRNENEDGENTCSETSDIPQFCIQYLSKEDIKPKDGVIRPKGDRITQNQPAKKSKIKINQPQIKRHVSGHVSEHVSGYVSGHVSDDSASEPLFDLTAIDRGKKPRISVIPEGREDDMAAVDQDSEETRLSCEDEENFT